ncbi:MAG: hypothetical protein E1N59_2041 [Puniceicoccaceae bacterium 5H]|nr:MAG: hypothetical protein E1N59_2041 [Puniceicoccaceae bacterium 5H]
MATLVQKRAYAISGTIHVLGLLVLIVMGLISAWKREPEPLEFELVDPADLTAAQAQQSQSAPAEPEQDEELAPLETSKLEDLPQVNPVELPPLPEPEPEPEPEPAPKVESKPPPKPAPKPKPKPKANYADWAKNRDLPKQVVKEAPKPKPVSAPRLQTSNLQQRLSSTVGQMDLNLPASTSAATQSQLQSYAQRVRARLQAAFQAVGVPGLEARASFTVTASGQFVGVRIVKGSGDSAFDAAVLAAFRQARSPGPPPDGEAKTWQLTFTAE